MQGVKKVQMTSWAALIAFWTCRAFSKIIFRFCFFSFAAFMPQQLSNKAGEVPMKASR